MKCFAFAVPNDKIARKYCFRATTAIHRVGSDRVYAVVFGYDSRPTIASVVENVAEGFCEANALQFETDDTQLIFHAECPIELNDEIMFQLLEDSGEDADDESDVAGA